MLIDFELENKTYRLHTAQAAVVHKLREDDPDRADALIRRYAVEVIKGDEVIKSKIETPASGQATQGFTSTSDT